MSDDTNGQSSTGKVPVYASVMVCVGLWGLLLAALNMVSIQPNTVLTLNVLNSC